MGKRAGVGLVLLGVIVGILVTSFVQMSGSSPSVAVVDPKPPPVPTYTPTPAAQSQGDYANAAAVAQDSLAAAMAQVVVLIAIPRLGDQSWLDEIDQAMHEAEDAYTDLLRLKPPEEWQTFHRRMTAGAADCSAAMHVLVFALEEQQPAAVEIVAALLGRCEAKLLAAQDLADEITTGAAAP